ncbi:MAG: RNA polymerase sigma factor [Nannocystaceae bacterium]|nr:RNA polymerase sigma factor [Nannocystaceae bacterium]
MGGTTRPGGVPKRAPLPIGDEASLLARARSGEMQAWASLYQTHFPRIFRHVRYLTGDTDLTEELVQESFARALVKLPSFDGRATLSTWLHGIALNIVRNHWRSLRSTETAHERLHRMNIASEAAQAPMIDDTHLCRKKAEAVYAILETLPEHLREAFVLRDLEGNTPAEAAALLGISAGNLSVRASRARERIRKELERLGWLAPRTETAS